MKRAFRVSLTLFAALALTAGAAACGDDDEAASGDSSTTESTTTTEAPAAEEEPGEGEEGSAPDVNPCAEGESGSFGPPAEPPGDGATPVTVTAADYSFSGHEEMSAKGEYALTFANEGSELHEIVVSRINDDETRPLEELLEEPDPSEFTTDVAFAFACPGATAEPVSVDLSEGGRYVLLCFIPVGTTPETDPAEFENMGPPHAMEGMIEEIQVS